MTTRIVVVALIVCVTPLFGACENPTPTSIAPVVDTAISADVMPIKYETVGKGDVALVFVHCWTCNLGSWDAQATYFAPHYQVVRLDLAGHVESGKGRKADTMPRSAPTWPQWWTGSD